jgi:protoporphyrinogen oxidase
VKEQLNVRLDAALARQLKQEAQEQGRTVGGIVALALEAWLAKASSVVAGASSSPDQQALAALEARVARLEAANKGDDITLKNKGNNITLKDNDEINLDNVRVTATSQSTTQGPDNIRTSKGSDNITTSEGLTTAELAIQTSTNKGAWNTWASKATVGDTRHHPQAGSWRLLGKAALASGGPPRWLWEQA